MGEIAGFSKETTDFTEFRDGAFEYLEIAGVEIGTNTYHTTLTNLADAPSRAKMKTQPGDIVVSTTRPNRGAIAQIGQQTIDWIRIDDLPNQPLDIEKSERSLQMKLRGHSLQSKKGIF